MKGSRQKRLEALANESSHGRQLTLIIAALRGQLNLKKQEWARAGEVRRASIKNEILQIEGLLELRQTELKQAIEASAAERAMA